MSKAEPGGHRPGPLKGLVFIAVMAALVAAAALVGLSQRSGHGAIVATQAPAPIPVRTARMQPEDGLQMQESFTGLAQARRSAALGFERGGRIEAIAADVGDRVRRRDVLARLDTRALGAQLNAARAQVDQAIAARDLALATFTRIDELAAKDLAPRQRRDEAEAGLTQTEAQIAAARAQAELVAVQLALSRIEAPFDGVVTARLADEGAIAGPGQPVLQLVEDGAVEVHFGLPAEVAVALDPAEDYALESAGGTVMARMTARTGVVDADARTVAVVFTPTGGVAVGPGETVRLKSGRALAERGFWLPVSALTESSRGLWAVYVAEPREGGFVAAPRLVEIVHVEGERAFVRGPLDAGEAVILDGLQRLVPGQPVAPAGAVAGAMANGAE